MRDSVCSWDFPGVPDEPYTKPCSVVRPWINNLSFKQQTVLLTALRGVDGKEKQDASKPFCKAMRMTILQNVSPGCGTFMSFEITGDDVAKFSENIDHYPIHWVLHFIHAAEIIGYHCPHSLLGNWWKNFYLTLVNAMHLQPETLEDLEVRLSDSV